MTVQNFYPVFENGQVLTSAALNDIIDYLEPQDRLTRSRLVGIGVACGLHPDWDGTVLTIGKGVAITSEGYLIAEPEVALDRMRPYTVPQPPAETATEEEKTEARYPFLFDGNTQREAFELLPTGFVAAPGEPAPIPLDAAILDDCTVMLFLERSRAVLKSCDINDCSDKGSEMSVTVRRLLVRRTTADRILVQEAEIAGRPVDRANHPRLALTPLRLQKLNLLGAGATTCAALANRQLETAGLLFLDALDTGRAAFEAYRPLLEPLWPPAHFPGGPLPDHALIPLLGHHAMMPVLGQYLYGAAHALTLALNEFLERAATFDAECAPVEGRFPRHVLLGDPVRRPVAFDDAPRTAADLARFDARTIRTGAGPTHPPAPRRHHFVPSPLHADGSAAEFRALFHRFVLIAQSYDTRALIGAVIRTTPSRDGHAPLGDRAIPAWLAFDPAGDLYASWSWRRTRAGLRDSVPAYALTPDSGRGHPLLLRDDATDFYRIEGVVGRPLGSAIAEIVRQKRALGLSFAIEPVRIPLGLDRDAADREAAAAVMRRLLLCQMRELDVVFLTLMAGLFAFMVWLVRTLGPVDARRATRPPVRLTGAVPIDGIGLRLKPITLDLKAEAELNRVAEGRLGTLRKTAVLDPRIVVDLALPEAAAQPLAVAALFDKARDRAAGGELIDRVRIAVGAADPQADADAIYPAVALLARAEEMMAAASAASIAAFDQPRFTTAMRGLADAYEGYAARAETDAEKAGPDVAAANAAILENRSVMAAAAAQLGGQTVTAELEKRLAAMADERTLDQYLARHPGAEHKGGVPAGGTLVLLYVPREALQPAVESGAKASAGLFEAFFTRITGQPAPALDVAAALEALRRSSAPVSDDPLESLVVVGDLCLPTLCCDGECGEQEILDRFSGRIIVRPGPRPDPDPDPDPDPEPEPGVIAGRVLMNRDRVQPLPRGTLLNIVDADGNRRTEPLGADGAFEIALPPGKYQVFATLRTVQSTEETVSLKPGARLELTLAFEL